MGGGDSGYALSLAMIKDIQSPFWDSLKNRYEIGLFQIQYAVI